MKKILIKIIIYLFEKYCFDYWIELQENEEMKKNNFETKEEYYDYLKDRQDEKHREIFEAGVQVGVEKYYN